MQLYKQELVATAMLSNRPYPQLRHKIKMVQRVRVVCTGNLWRELHFKMLAMKNVGFDSGGAY